MDSIYNMLFCVGTSGVIHYTSKSTLTYIPFPPGPPYNGLYGEAPPERGTFFQASGI